MGSTLVQYRGGDYRGEFSSMGEGMFGLGEGMVGGRGGWGWGVGFWRRKDAHVPYLNYKS